jgi:hypothetical protein
LNYYYYPQFFDSKSDYNLLRQMQHGTIPQHGGVQGSPQQQHGGGPQHGFPPQPPPPHHGGGGPGYPPHDGGQHHHDGPPQGPPPGYIPHETVSQFAVEAGGLRPCLFRYTYIWLRNGRNFWFYPTFVGRTSTAGYRWNGRNWQYYGTDLNRIRSFRCH